MSRWGGQPMAAPPDLVHAAIDTLAALGWAPVGAALDPETSNDTAPSRLPFIGVALDSARTEAGGHLLTGTLRLQVWASNPSPASALALRLAGALTGGALRWPDGVSGAELVTMYGPVVDSRTGLRVCSLVVNLSARFAGTTV